MASEPEAQSAVSKEIQSTFAQALLSQRQNHACLSGGGFRFFGGPEDGGATGGDPLEGFDAEPVEKAVAPEARMEEIAKGLRILERERPDLRVGWAARLAERHAAMTGSHRP
jgi:hypothetical protein